MGKVWGIAERTCRDNWKARMTLFEALVEGVLMYGAEIWGWREYEELERIQDKYIKWTLKLAKTTPSYVIHLEVKRDKLSTKAGKRALKYEEKVWKGKNETLIECVKVKSIAQDRIKKEEKNERMKKNRKEFFQKVGWSQKYYEEKLRNEGSVWRELEEIMKDVHRQRWTTALEKSRCAAEYKELVPGWTEMPKYLNCRGRSARKSLEVTARFRTGCEARASFFWKGQKEKTCRLCGKEEETMKHIFENCEVSGKAEKEWKEQITAKGALARMMDILRRRKRLEEKEE